MNKTMLFTAVLSASMFFAGCSENKTNTNTVSSSAVSSFPETIVLQEKPENAISINDALVKIEKGKKIAVSGIIGGKNCFDSELAIFSLTQKIIPDSDCTAAITGKCKKGTPAVLIQYKGKDGKVIKRTLEGFKGLRENIAVVVSGSIDDISTDKYLVINLEGFYILPEKSINKP